MGISSKQKFLSGLNDEDEILFAHLYDLAACSEKYGCANDTAIFCPSMRRVSCRLRKKSSSATIFPVRRT